MFGSYQCTALLISLLREPQPLFWHSPTHQHLHHVIGMCLSTWGCGKDGLWPLVIHLAHGFPPGALLELISPPERQFIFTWAQSHANAALQFSKWSWPGAGICLASVEHRQRSLSMQVYCKSLLKGLIFVKALQTRTQCVKGFSKAWGRPTLSSFLRSSTLRHSSK